MLGRAIVLVLDVELASLAITSTVKPLSPGPLRSVQVIHGMLHVQAHLAADDVRLQLAHFRAAGLR